MRDILKEVASAQMVREAHAYTRRAVARAEGTWSRADELRGLDTDLIACSRDLIARARHRLAVLDKPGEAPSVGNSLLALSRVTP
jgi:hypothetical protein